MNDYQLKIILPPQLKMTRGKRRRGLTISEKQQICRQSLEPEHRKEKLKGFGEHFCDKDVSI